MRFGKLWKNFHDSRPFKKSLVDAQRAEKFWVSRTRVSCSVQPT